MKNKVYLILYYISFIITLTLCIRTFFNINIPIERQIIFLGEQAFKYYVLLISLNITIFILFTIKIIRRKAFDNLSLIVPISYLVFYLFILIICLLYDKIVMIKNLHYAYYEIFLLFAYLFFNIYSLLGFDYKKIKLSK